MRSVLLSLPCILACHTTLHYHKRIFVNNVDVNSHPISYFPLHSCRDSTFFWEGVVCSPGSGRVKPHIAVYKREFALAYLESVDDMTTPPCWGAGQTKSRAREAWPQNHPFLVNPCVLQTRRQELLTFQVSNYCLLALQRWTRPFSIQITWPNSFPYEVHN